MPEISIRKPRLNEKSSFSFDAIFLLKPIPQPRPRARRFGAQGIQIYTPTGVEIKAYKEAIAAEVRKALPEGWALDNFCAEVGISFYLSSTTNPLGARNVGDMAEHHQKPDLDNLAKPVLDALTGVLWADDGQVSSLLLEKFYCPVESVTPRGRRIFKSPFFRLQICCSSI